MIELTQDDVKAALIEAAQSDEIHASTEPYMDFDLDPPEVVIDGTLRLDLIASAVNNIFIRKQGELYTVQHARFGWRVVHPSGQILSAGKSGDMKFWSRKAAAKVAKTLNDTLVA